MPQKKTTKTVLAIAASPNQGGNSDTLLDAFIKGLKKPHPINVEKVYLCDVAAHHYDHPHKLPDTKTEPELCQLCEKYQNADAIVIATPTYNFNVPALLKNFIDRIGFFALDYKKINSLGQPTGKLEKYHHFFIVTGGTPTHMKWFLFFLYPDFWLKAIYAYYGCWKTKSSYSGGLTFRSPAKTKPDLLQSYEAMGERFAQKISNS